MSSEIRNHVTLIQALSTGRAVLGASRVHVLPYPIGDYIGYSQVKAICEGKPLIRFKPVNISDFGALINTRVCFFCAKKLASNNENKTTSTDNPFPKCLRPVARKLSVAAECDSKSQPITGIDYGSIERRALARLIAEPESLAE